MTGDRRQTILVVDDVPDNIDVLSGLLRPHYRVRAATSGERALQIARTLPHPDLILLDIMMPGMDGYQVCRELKADPRTRRLPVIFITARSEVEDEAKGLALGAVDYITKPVSPPIVLARVRTQLALYDQNRRLERKVRERTAELVTTRLEIIRRLGRAAEFKDNETGLHVIRMSHYTRLLAEALGSDAEWVDLLFNAAPMHDIGKIGIPDRILLKPGPLDQEEWVEMRRHPQYGADIIGEHDSALLRLSREIALNHHERWNGSGYPSGLRETAIPLSARIVAVADVFDALTTRRPYKHAWSIEQAVDYMREQSAIQFDPELVTLFDRILPQILEVRSRYEETE